MHYIELKFSIHVFWCIFRPLIRVVLKREDQINEAASGGNRKQPQVVGL